MIKEKILIKEKEINIKFGEYFSNKIPEIKGPKKNPIRLNSEIEYSNSLLLSVEISVIKMSILGRESVSPHVKKIIEINKTI